MARTHILRNGEALPDHIEEMAGSRAIRPAALQVNGHNPARAHLDQRLSWNRIRQHSVHQPAPANIHWQEHPGICTTGTHRIDQRPGVEHHALTGAQVGGGHGHRKAQFLKRLHFQNAVQKADHALVGGKSMTRERPARKGLEANAAGYLFQFSGGKSAAVRRADQRTHARAGHKTDGYFFFFENFQNADMSDAAGKPATQRDSDSRSGRRRFRSSRAARQFPSKSLDRANDPFKRLHSSPTSGCPELLLPHVLSKMPFAPQMVQTTVVLSFVPGNYPRDVTAAAPVATGVPPVGARRQPDRFHSKVATPFVTNCFIPVNLCAHGARILSRRGGYSAPVR